MQKRYGLTRHLQRGALLIIGPTLIALGCEGAAVDTLELEGNLIEDAQGDEDALSRTNDSMLWSDARSATHHADPNEDSNDTDSGPGQATEGDATLSATPCPEDLPYASEVISFDPGVNAGFGQTKMPGVVLGPPTPGSPRSGSIDVLTLGVGGEIVLGFGERRIVNGPGPDLIVWENPFWQGGDPENPFAEFGEVSVSDDGETWHTFPCDVEVEEGFDPFCAGWRTRGDFDPCTLIPLDPALSGGDPFDLEALGLESVRFVRIRDLAIEGGPPSAGFDLDAIGAIHIEDID